MPVVKDVKKLEFILPTRGDRVLPGTVVVYDSKGREVGEYVVPGHENSLYVDVNDEDITYDILDEMGYDEEYVKEFDRPVVCKINKEGSGVNSYLSIECNSTK